MPIRRAVPILPLTSTETKAVAPAVRAWINSTPWSYFTVDGDPTQHETVKTIEVAPGKHRVQFSNPVLRLERAVTIEVPEDHDLTYVERLGN